MCRLGRSQDALHWGQPGGSAGAGAGAVRGFQLSHPSATLARQLELKWAQSGIPGSPFVGATLTR